MTKAATKQVEDFTAETKKTMEEGVEKMSKGFEDATPVRPAECRGDGCLGQGPSPRPPKR